MAGGNYILSYCGSLTRSNPSPGRPWEEHLFRGAFYCGFAAVAASLASIAASQILLGLALAALLAARRDWRFPPVALPLALFVAATLAAAALSPDPAAALPQIRKLYVLTTLFVVYSGFRGARPVSRLVTVLAVVGAASAAWGLAQFAGKWMEARELGVPFYTHYVGRRITGFMSHWQTMGGGLMLVFLLWSARLLSGGWKSRGQRLAGAAAAVLIGAAIVLGFTRNVWLGSFAGGLYLLWHWNRRVIWAVPVAAVLVVAAGPEALRSRVFSLFQPHGEVDSNQHRIVTYRTGMRMIRAHPLFGVGPDQVDSRFEEFVPPDVPRPLPEGWYGHLHNVYLQYAAERGIPALGCFLWFVAIVMRDLLRSRRRHWYLDAAAAAVLAILVSAFFEMNLGDSEVLMLFLAVIAAAYSVRDAVRDRVEPEGGHG